MNIVLLGLGFWALAMVILFALMRIASDQEHAASDEEKAMRRLRRARVNARRSKPHSDELVHTPRKLRAAA